MKIIIKKTVETNLDRAAKRFIDCNIEVFKRARYYLRQLEVICTNFDCNIRSKMNSSPNTIPMLTEMMKFILLARNIINCLDNAAKQSEVCIPEIQSFKETLNDVQEYHDIVFTEFYEHTSHADIPDEDSDEPPAGDSKMKGSGPEEITLEIIGLDKLGLNEAAREKFEEGFSALINQVVFG